MIQQQFSYSDHINAVRTKIHDVFYYPESKLNWPFKSFGIGINRKIIQLVREKESDLVIEIESGPIAGTWIINYHDLIMFIDMYETEYIVKSHYILNVLAANLFRWFNE